MRKLALVALVTVIGLTLATPSGASFGGAPSGSFQVVCNYSHSLKDDPIVHFGLPGASHSHDFFGNVTTNAYSTTTSLQDSATTCNRPQDHSGYWAPTVFYKGVPIAPTKVQVYYNNNNRPNLAPLPTGLEIVAGDAHATGPQDTSQVGWSCSDSLGPQPMVAMPPECPTGTTLKMMIRFPGCWDGVHLTSPDFKSHMAYASGQFHDGPCPAGYPIAVVTANPEFKYPISDGSGVTLSSGPAYTEHADFFDAWDQATMNNLVTTCVNAGVKCKLN